MTTEKMCFGKMMQGIALFLEGTGLDVDDQHLVKTPNRVAKAWCDTFLSGYAVDPKDILTVQFKEAYDQMIVVKDIPFSSMCAHHLLPFFGTAKIGYIPANKKVTGISKLARILEIFSRRLQIQERLAEDVAGAINDILQPAGVGVILRARHLCMTDRGVMKPGSITITSCLHGAMKDEACTRSEFMSL